MLQLPRIAETLQRRLHERRRRRLLCDAKWDSSRLLRQTSTIATSHSVPTKSKLRESPRSSTTHRLANAVLCEQRGEPFRLRTAMWRQPFFLFFCFCIIIFWRDTRQNAWVYRSTTRKATLQFQQTRSRDTPSRVALSAIRFAAASSRASANAVLGISSARNVGA